MLHSLTLCARIVVPISFQKVDNAPNTEASADGDHEGLENFYSRVEKIHIIIWSRVFYFVVLLLFV